MASEAQNDDKVQKLLQEAGLDENSPIDPSSRIALQELLMNKSAASEPKDPLQQPDAPPPPPIDQVSTSNKVLQHCVSDLSDAPGLLGQPMTQLSSSVASTAGSVDDETKEDRILRQLEQQSAMILELHKRMDELTTLVGQQSSNGEANQQQRQTTTTAPQERLRDVPIAAARYAEVPAANVPQQRAPLQPGGIMDNPGMTWVRECLTRLVKMFLLFGALRRRHAPNLNGGLMLKLFIMLAILLGRFGRRRRVGRSTEDWVWDYRFYFLVTLVVGGFMIQSGFVKFLYVFFVKENYPRRIWNGEDIDIEHEAGLAPARPPHAVLRRQQQEQAAPADNNRRDWRQTLLGGGIAAPPNDQEQQQGPLRIVMDVGFFVASFFLSIFPMWRPEAIPVAQPEQEEEQEDEADDGAGLPDVQPPRDPFEAAEDDDDDNEGGGE